MKQTHLAIALALVAMAGLAYYASLGSDGGANPVATATTATTPADTTVAVPVGAAQSTLTTADPGAEVIGKDGYWPSPPNDAIDLAKYPTPDPCKAVPLPEDMRKTCEMEAYSASLQQQSVGELLSVWQATEANGDGKADIVNKILAEKIQQLPNDDPVYDTLRNLALNSPDSLALSKVASLLGEIGTAPVVGIAQDLIAQGKLETGLGVLDGMASTRSIAKWDASRKQPPPPLGDTLQTAWGKVQGDTQDEYWQRVRLANIMAVEGSEMDASFLLHNVQNPALNTEVREMLQNAIGKLNNPQLIPYLSQQLHNHKPDEPAFQGSAAALAGMATLDGTKALLKWAQTRAVDADADRVKVWFSQSAGIMQYDSKGQPHNVIKPLAESGNFQSAAVKAAVLAGIAAQERQLSPQPSQAQ